MYKRQARLAHWIKGSGGTVGLPKLSDLAMQCEKAIKAEQIDTVLESIEEISQFVATVNQERNPEGLSESSEARPS